MKAAHLYGLLTKDRASDIFSEFKIESGNKKGKKDEGLKNYHSMLKYNKQKDSLNNIYNKLKIMINMKIV